MAFGEVYCLVYLTVITHTVVIYFIN